MNSLRTPTFFFCYINHLEAHSTAAFVTQCTTEAREKPGARRYSLHEAREVWRWCEGSLGDSGKAREKAICKLAVVGRKEGRRGGGWPSTCSTYQVPTVSQRYEQLAAQPLTILEAWSSSLLVVSFQFVCQPLSRGSHWTTGDPPSVGGLTPQRWHQPSCNIPKCSWLCQIALSKVVVMATWPLFNLTLTITKGQKSKVVTELVGLTWNLPERCGGG